MASGHTQQPKHDHSVPGRRLARPEWAELIGAGDRFDEVLFVDGLGATLLTHVRLQMVRRAATEAIRLRTEHLRAQQPSSDLVDDADAAADRLQNTLKHMDAKQGEGVEPAARVIAMLTHREYVAACFDAQDIVAPAEIVDLALQALRLPRLDSDTSIKLIMNRVTVKDAVSVGVVLGERYWWPRPLRELAVDHVRSGRPIGPLVDCLDGLGFSNLTPMQQRAALRLLTSPSNPYGMDPNAIAAVVRGVALDDDLAAELRRPAEP